MADKLTQLQDCLDDLLTQMYATLSYIQQRHPYGEIPGQPSQAPSTLPTSVPNSAVPALMNGDASTYANTQGAQQQADAQPQEPAPEEPRQFQANMRELARDLILKEQQIEYLIQSLPGIGASESEQIERMRELEEQLREVDKEREEAEEVREGLAAMVGNMLVTTKRVPG